MRPTEKPREQETCRWEVSSKGKKPRRATATLFKKAQIPIRKHLLGSLPESAHKATVSQHKRACSERAFMLKPILTSLNQLKTTCQGSFHQATTAQKTRPERRRLRVSAAAEDSVTRSPFQFYVQGNERFSLWKAGPAQAGTVTACTPAEQRPS